MRAVLTSNSNTSLPQLQKQLTLWILWKIWKNRNELLDRKQGNQWQHDLQKVVVDAQEWISVLQMQDCDHNISGTISISQSPLQWTKPSLGYLKCNYDCRFNSTGLSHGAWILRDFDGFFREAGQNMGNHCTTVI